MKYHFFALLPVLALGACNDQQPVRIINTTSYPNLPPIELPPMADLEDVRFSLPGDLTQRIIKNTPTCQSVLPENRDKVFWYKCGQYTDIDGNVIYLTLTKEEFEKLRRNLEKLKVRDQQFESRLKLVNQQRAEYRRLNREATTATVKP